MNTPRMMPSFILRRPMNNTDVASPVKREMIILFSSGTCLRNSRILFTKLLITLFSIIITTTVFSLKSIGLFFSSDCLSLVFLLVFPCISCDVSDRASFHLRRKMTNCHGVLTRTLFSKHNKANYLRNRVGR
jgi:hypothetical protein